MATPTTKITDKPEAPEPQGSVNPTPKEVVENKAKEKENLDPIQEKGRGVGVHNR